MTKPLLSIICAMDKNRLIGNNNQLPWHLPADLAFFKRTTLGKPIVMGRNTFESIGKPLPGRQNIVITSNPQWQAQGCDRVCSIEAALDLVESEAEVMLIGGASLYRQTIEIADILYLTMIDHAFQGDTWFPEFDIRQWRIESQTAVASDQNSSFSYSFVKYLREKSEVLQ